jgi:hypothetical protein
MTPASTRPGGRHLAAWWRELAARQARRIWLADLLLHRVEALVLAAHPTRPDPFARTVLHGLADAGEPVEPASIATRLHIDRQVAARLLPTLHSAGLARTVAGRWELTPAGRENLDAEQWLVPAPRRQAFHFLDNAVLGQPPHYLRLEPLAQSLAIPPPEGWRFDLQLLRDCVERTPGWKHRHHFPTEVIAVLGPAVGNGEKLALESPEWRRVTVDRPERLRLALAEIPGGLLGFGVADDGSLRHDPPVLELEGTGDEVFPDLAAEPSADAWQHAWQDWSLRCGLLPEEIAAATLERALNRLVIRAPSELARRLRELVEKEGCVAAGTGRLRPLALLEVVGVGQQ